MRRVALLTIFAFGCATVRVPVSAASEPVDGPGVIAPPITELWIESSEQVPAEQSAQADAQARAALAQALAARDIPPDAAGATDAVLFVRERAVATTEARQSQQTWAKVGIVVGIVLVVAAVVIVAVASKGSSPSPAPSTKSAHSIGAKRPGAPVSVKPRSNPATPPVATPRLAPGPPPTAIVPPAAPVYGGRSGSPIYVGFDFNFWIRPGPLVLASEEPPVPLAPDASPFEDGEALFEAGPPPPPDPETIAEVALELPPLSPEVSFNVQDRSFFAGPQTALQLDLIDRATGRLLWSKAVNAEADPLDAGAIGKVLDEALKDVSWAPRRSR